MFEVESDNPLQAESICRRRHLQLKTEKKFLNCIFNFSSLSSTSSECSPVSATMQLSCLFLVASCSSVYFRKFVIDLFATFQTRNLTVFSSPQFVIGYQITEGLFSQFLILVYSSLCQINLKLFKKISDTFKNPYKNKLVFTLKNTQF